MIPYIRQAARFFFGRVAPRRPYRVVRGPLRGSRFVLGSLSGEGGGASVYFDMMETEQTAEMLRSISSGGVFFDIGANVGYYSILASRLVGANGRVVAFEPVVRNLAYLQRHVELNSAWNVTVLPFAVAGENGILSFSTGPDNAMGSIDRSGGSADVLVPAVTLDDISSRLGLIPDVIKIDVEGAEMEVLEGGRRTIGDRGPTIFLSTHSTELRSECLDLLQDLRYETRPLVEGDAHEFIARR